MSNKIDPSYLRYIHDGLHSGSIHAENASSLPEGLTGLYEASFLGELNVKESQQLLKRFAYFSVIKKEVSCHFVAITLDEPESEIVDFITTYSKWFNSAQAGKYSIYHERLRTYILSSISQNEFDSINGRIIALSQVALANRSNDEWEYYALEYLSNHLFIASMISGNGGVLKKLAYDTAHWNRQIEISKGFEWSKKMLNEMMQWAAKYDEEEVIECALNKVDLHHMEQNDAPRIVELVANNDIETALQRIEAFGGNDKEGLQRKFILYMLCLMELTLLDSKDKPFRKEAIEKLLRYLDDNMPEDKISLSLNHFYVNNPLSKWEEIFPSHLVFQIACVFYELGIDYFVIYKRVTKWDTKWIEKKVSFSQNELVVLIEVALRTDDFVKHSILSKISNVLAKQGEIARSIEFANKIINKNKRSSTFKNNAIELVKNGNPKEALLILNEISTIKERCKSILELTKILFEQSNLVLFDKFIVISIEITETIIEPKTVATFYIEIAELLIKRNKLELAIKVIRNSIKISVEIIDESDKNDIDIENSLLLFRVGLIDESKSSIYKINDSFKRLNALLKIAGLFAANGEINKWDELIEEVLTQVSEINDSNELHQILIKVSIETVKYGSIKNLLFIVSLFEDASNRFELLIHVIYELLNKRNESEFKIILKEFLSIEEEFEISGIVGDLMGSKVLNILTDIIIKFNVDYAIQFYRIVSNKMKKYEHRMMSIIFSEFIKISDYDKLEEFVKLPHRDIEKINIINTYIEAVIILKDKNQLKNDMIPFILKKVQSLNQEIENPVFRDQIYSELACQLALHIKIDKSLGILNKISDLNYFGNALLKLSNIYSVSNFDNSLKLNNDLIMRFVKSSLGKFDDLEKSIIINEVGIQMIENGNVQNVKELSEKIPYHYEKICLYSKISIEMAKIGQIDDSMIWLNKISSNNDESFKDNFEREYSNNMAYEIKCVTILVIMDETDSQGNVQLSDVLFNEISELAEQITNDKIKSEINTGIKKYLFKKRAKSIIPEQAIIRNYSKLKNKNNDLRIQIVKSNYLFTILQNEICQIKLNEFSKTVSALYYFSIFDLFFGKPDFEKINRYNRSLNIQWAIDIKNSFSEN